MGLAGARNSAVTGLQAQSTSISISADNIANASTPGYKAIIGQFSTLVTNSDTSTGFSSGGVSVSAKSLIEKQGLVEATGRVTDLAISGSGFFAVQDESGTLLLTRAGSFDINNRGELVNPVGQTLLGWPLDNDGRLPGETGNLNTTAAESTSSLQIVDTNSASGTASPSTTVSAGMNLNAGQAVFQGATATLTPASTANSSISQYDIVVPATGMQEGDTISFTADNLTTAFQYGGFAKSFNVTTATIFGSSTTNGTFTTGSLLANGDQFTISTTSSGTVTFTFQQSSPDTTSGQFNSFDTLATAINNSTGLTARTSGGVLYVSSEDAREAITFGNVNSSNLAYELGFSDEAAAASGVNRWNTFAGLSELIDATSQLGAVINNANSGANIEIFSVDPLLEMTVTKEDNQVVIDLQSAENGTNDSDDIIVPVAGTTMANGDTIVLNDDQDAAGNSLTLTYGGIEASDVISSSNAMFTATTTAGTFGGGSITDGHAFTINDGGGATTFTYTAVNPNTAAGQFNSLATLAQAIEASADYHARIVNDTLYISAIDADLGLTFANVAATDFLTEFGLANVAASGGTTRFATLGELQAIVDGNANFTATLSGSSNSIVTITSATSATGLEILDSSNSLIYELGIADNHDVGDGFFTEMGLTTLVGATEQTADIEVTYDPSDATKNMAGGNITAHFPRNIEIYDALGTGHDFRLSFLKIGVNLWAVEFYALDASEISGGTDGLIASGTVRFNGDGTLNSVTGDIATTISLPWTTGASSHDMVFNFGTAGQPAGTSGAASIGLTDGLRQFDSAYNVEFIEQNGVAAGQFKGITISEDGTVNANFSNGEIKPIYKLPILMVANQNALAPRTGNTFAVTQASGEVNLKQAGAGGAGVVIPGALEGSTADIAEELTRTIGIQSNYNANATLISTVRDMEEELNRRL